MTRILQRVQRMICGLHGHETVLHFEPHRLSLRCLNCGHETSGWSLRPETCRRLQADAYSLRHLNGFGRWNRLADQSGRHAAA
jgi:hypothetical protein